MAKKIEVINGPIAHEGALLGAGDTAVFEDADAETLTRLGIIKIIGEPDDPAAVAKQKVAKAGDAPIEGAETPVALETQKGDVPVRVKEK